MFSAESGVPSLNTRWISSNCSPAFRARSSKREAAWSCPCSRARSACTLDIEALSELVWALPEDFPAPIFSAQHLDSERESNLNEILSSQHAARAHRLR